MSESALVLGTAQLGMDYGITNDTGRPDQKMIDAMIRCAFDAGIRQFDTAQVYGESEKVLGEAFARLGITNAVKVVTKISLIPGSTTASVMHLVDESLKRLRVDRIYGLLFHHESVLDEPLECLHEILDKMKSSGKIQAVGVSVYDPQKALKVLKNDSFHLVQIPTNALDFRFEQAGVFESARENSKIVYIRSALLQGLLVRNFEVFPERMNFALSEVRRFDEFASELGVSRLDLALGYLRAKYPQAGLIFGAETLQQLKENIKAYEFCVPDEFLDKIKHAFFEINPRILDPRIWPKEGCE